MKSICILPRPIIFILLVLVFAGCTPTSNHTKTSALEPTLLNQSIIYSQNQNHSDASSVLPQRWPRSFSIQLQHAAREKLLSQPHDLYIVDIDDAMFTSQDIDAIHATGAKVFSYLSIGEAEHYRTYWKNDWKKGNPTWLDEENPNWEGNYKVKYWDPAWKDIMKNQIDRIIESGYDGVYLDVVDAFDYWQERGVGDSRLKMEQFIIALSNQAKKKRNNFLVVPQNAPELLVGTPYLAAIDGVGKEDTWYSEEDPVPEKENQIAILALDGAYANGKFVLVIDYPLTRLKKCDFISKARSHWFVPTTGPRELDETWEEPAC